MGIFQGGVPTRPDVERLMKTGCEPGTARDLSEIAQVIGERVGSMRLRTVVTSWRKALFREKGIQTKLEADKLHFLTAEQAQDLGYWRFKLLGRAAGRHRVKLESIPVAELSEERREKHYLLVREARALSEVASKAQKEIAAPKPVSGLPRPPVR